MKIIGDGIDAIVKFKGKNKPEPIKFSIADSDGAGRVIKVDKVICVEEDNSAGIKSYVYRCQSQIEGELKLYELKYYIQDCRWVLYKI